MIPTSAQSPADKTLRERQEKKAGLGEGKIGTSKERRNFRAIIADVTEFQAFMTQKFFCCSGLFMGQSHRVWDGPHAQGNQYFCSLVTGQPICFFFLVGSRRESRNLTAPELDSITGGNFKPHIF